MVRDLWFSVAARLLNSAACELKVNVLLIRVVIASCRTSVSFNTTLCVQLIVFLD